jgi:beta-xylosidase
VVKPKTTSPSAPNAPYVRSDAFTGPKLANVWEWNHVPDDTKWSLTERAGYLRLHSLPAPNFWMARNSLTQRAIGPQSTATTKLDAAGMKEGDVAGLALLNRPYAWIGVRRSANGLMLQQYDETVDSTMSTPLAGKTVWLRAESDFLTEQTHFAYSTNGTTWTTFGRPFITAFQLKTFQGVRFALFDYNDGGSAGGVADFDLMRIDEPHPSGFMQPIPTGRTITLKAAGRDTPFPSRGRAPSR